MAAPEFDRIWLMAKAGVRLSEKPVTWGEEPVAVHVNEVPATFEVSPIAVAELLHCDFAGGLFDKSGVGYTVTVKVVIMPSQPLACGMIWYVTVSMLYPELIRV